MNQYHVNIMNGKIQQNEPFILMKNRIFFLKDAFVPLFLSFNGCPMCNSSMGEKAISKFLDNYNIKYQREYRFKDCRNVFPLPFDFYIKDLNICIEYDGIQHFECTKGWNKYEDRIKYIQNNDAIKNNYCVDKNIRLIRIPYTKLDTISNVLKKELIE